LCFVHSQWCGSIIFRGGDTWHFRNKQRRALRGFRLLRTGHPLQQVKRQSNLLGLGPELVLQFLLDAVQRSPYSRGEKMRCWILVLFCTVFSQASVFAAISGPGVCPASAPVTGNNCYFVSASGSDSAVGNSESTPWLHAPGMPNCASNCLTVQTAGLNPGNGVIFRGGDTWHFGNSSATSYTGGTWDVSNWWGTVTSCVYEGTQTGCIYYGVDQTWYTGASWTRPIFDGDNPLSTSQVSTCTYQTAGGENNNLTQIAPNSIFDNFEMRGLCTTWSNPGQGSANAYIAYFGTGIGGSGMAIEENLYIHGWTATAPTSQAISIGGTGCNMIGGGYNGLQSIDHLVIDGTDSNPGACTWGIFPSFYHMRDSIVRYTTQGVGQWCHDIHDNIFEHFYNPVIPTHGNILECNDDSSGNAPGQPANTPNVFYNNIFRHDDASFGPAGQVHFWICPEVVPEYIFNNLFYDIANENYIDIAGPPIYSCPNTGGQFMFNNTLVDGTQPCSLPNNTAGGKYLSVFNQHLINTPFDAGTTACTGLNSTTNIAMSDATATAQGYTTGTGGTDGGSNTCANESTTPCAPTAKTNATVSAGSNYQAYCTALGGYSSEYAIGTEAAAACKYNATDGCTYNTSTHTMVCPAQTANSRPPSAAWDAGAYQFFPTPGLIQPPTNLQITVQ